MQDEFWCVPTTPGRGWKGACALLSFSTCLPAGSSIGFGFRTRPLLVVNSSVLSSLFIVVRFVVVNHITKPTCLTCTEQNFVTKAGAQAHAAKHGVCVVAPDTSPRGCNIEGEEDSWDFGTGAGFYVDATEEKWKANYRMYSYVTKELPSLINDNFPVDADKKSITGHSMGGHGALISYLRNPGAYQSVSAFAPICNPVECPWGQKAFSGYLGADKEAWKEYDSCLLLKGYSGPKTEILVDQGEGDSFLPAGQLLPDHLVAACAGAGITLNLRMHKDYDHSYYFIASFMGDHFDHHAKFLKA